MLLSEVLPEQLFVGLKVRSLTTGHSGVVSDLGPSGRHGMVDPDVVVLWETGEKSWQFHSATWKVILDVQEDEVTPRKATKTSPKQG